MNISDLYGKHNGETLYIIGSGPSLRFFPVEFLRDKFTIGLNQAWKSLPFQCTYNLSIHPDECIPKHFSDLQQIWITKKKGWLIDKHSKNKRIYWFNNQTNVHNYAHLTCKSDNLYVGRGIHTSALSLASKMGVSYAILVGIDFNHVGGDHHATAQSVRFHGLPPSEVYREYYLNFCKIRELLKNKLQIVSMLPFCGLHRSHEEYEKLLELTGEEKLPQAKDDSKYKRKGVDFT